MFARALIGVQATPYVIRQYQRAHDSLPLAPVNGFNRVLMVVAASGPTLTRIADAYARIFARRAILRRKLVVMLAILESSTPADAAFKPRGSGLGAWLALATAGIGAVLATVAGVILMGPLHIVSRIAAGRV
jgi:hypothetical protein